MDAAVRDGKHYQFGAFHLDPTRRVLTRDGAQVPLSSTLFDTLLYLLEHPGRVVSKDELLDAVWPRKTVDPSNVGQTIFSLRRALTAAGAREGLIATAPGEGYRFAEAVEVHDRKSASPPPGPGSAGTAPASGRLRAAVRTLGRRRMLALVVGLAAVAAGAAIWRWADTHSARAHSLVVLADFQNLTSDPLFDKTFAVASRIDLQQSPNLSVLSDQQTQDTLSLMTRSPNDRVTPAVALEVCKRNNGSAAIDGTVAQVGGSYLLTLTATACADGQVRAVEKAEVSQRDQLLPALDRMVGRMRRLLGESSASVRKHSAPLLQRRTASLDALGAYSQAFYSAAHGRRAEAIPMLEHAIELDPNFAAAYSDLAVLYYNQHEPALADQTIRKAYALRETTSIPEKLTIELRYTAFVSRDFVKEIEILRTGTELYPDNGLYWSNLSNAENWLGQYPQAIADGRQALALQPDAESAYVVYARALLHGGRYAEAQAVCEKAMARHVDGDDLRGVLFELAIARDDATGAQQQIDWAKGRPGERSMLIEEIQAALGQGKVKLAMADYARYVEVIKPAGFANTFNAPLVLLLHNMGLDDIARQQLAQIAPGYDSADYRTALAQFGDADRALTLLDADLKKTPTDTLLTLQSAAEVRASLAIRNHQPKAAVEALKPALPVEMRTFDVPYLRGTAYLQDNDGAHAAIEFRKILDNRGVEAVSPHYQLAQLGLARALRLQNQRAESRKAYAALFTDWRDADSDLPLLRVARAEEAALR